MAYLYNTIRNYYETGLQPSAKTLLYHEEERIRSLVVNVTLFPFELSQRWDEKLENIQVSNVDNSSKDVAMSLSYFKLHKIKKMFEQNQKDIEKSTNWDETRQLMEVHRYLKGIEREITQQLGTVILK